MAEVLVEFDSTFQAPDGKHYYARACARERPDRLWEGWLEFVPPDGGPPLRTGRETTQPNREDVLYWATGLTATYIEGALMRLLAPVPPVTAREVLTQPAFEGPAEPTAILDPFYVYGEGDQILRAQLNALEAGQLRSICRTYGIADQDSLAVANHAELVALIMTAVEKRAA